MLVPMTDALDLLMPFAAWLVAGSVVLFVLGLVLLPWFVARLPVDYFVNPGPASRAFGPRHPVVRTTLRFVKNTAGALLLVAGLLMLVLPGQGLLTIFMGLTLLEFPGKRQLELKLVRRRPVHKAINWLREKAKKAPLIVPE